MNALQYGWNKEQAMAGSFWVAFGACTREPMSWKEEIYAAARLIAGKAKKPIWVASSGGIDSEIVCRAFFDQGIAFSVLTFEHAAGTNQHDILFAKKWCYEHGVRQHIVSINMDVLLETDIDAYRTQGVIADHPYRFFQLKILETIESLGGYGVLGGGDQLYEIDPQKKEPVANDIYLEFNVGKAAPFEWIKKHNIDHIPSFFLSTPELCLSFMRIPLVDFVLRHPDILMHPTNSYTLKQMVCKSVWTDIKARYKYDGFEKIRTRAHVKRDELRKELGAKFQIVRLPVPEVRRQLAAQLPAYTQAL